MSAKYKFVKNPPSLSKKDVNNLHARIVPARTATIDDLAEEISTMSSFSLGDIKGVLESFTQVVTNRLKNGENVNLDGLGHYSVSLECPKDITSEKQIRAESIRFKNVNFRCSKKMKSRLNTMKLERLPADKKKVYPVEERLQRILTYLHSHRTVTCSSCISFNQCSRGTAVNDLQSLIDAGKVERLGVGKNVLYLLLA